MQKKPETSQKEQVKGHNCNTTDQKNDKAKQPPTAKPSRKQQQQEQKKAEEEAAKKAAEQKLRDELDALQEKEQIEQFKLQNRVQIEMIHAFGSFPGEGVSLTGNYEQAVLQPKKTIKSNSRSNQNATPTPISGIPMSTEKKENFPREIKGHIHIIKDKYKIFSELDQNDNKNKSNDPVFKGDAEIENELKQYAMMGEQSTQSTTKISKLTTPKSNMILVYPVGMHVAFRSIDNNRMKFLQLPNITKAVQAIQINHAVNQIAVAVRLWEFEERDHQVIQILFYSIDKDIFKKQKQYTIKLTQNRSGQTGIPYTYFQPNEQSRKGSILNNFGQSFKSSDNTPIVGKQEQNKQIFERYVQSMIFSNCDKYFAVCLRNGQNEYIVQTFELSVKGKVISQIKFNQQVAQLMFMNKDPFKIIVAGQDIFRFYSTNMKLFQELPKFERLPDTESNQNDFDFSPMISNLNSLKYQLEQDPFEQYPIQGPLVFTDIAYRDNDQLIGISNQGHIFVIEVMQVIQIIHESEMVEPGTETKKRLKLLKLVPNQFGFIVACEDILYFFKYVPNNLELDEKGRVKQEFQNQIPNDVIDIQFKGYYKCILKWRPEELRETKILGLNICEGDKKEESMCAISTKDGQLMYMNLFKEVYFPENQKVIQDLLNQERAQKYGQPTEAEAQDASPRQQSQNSEKQEETSQAKSEITSSQDCESEEKDKVHMSKMQVNKRSNTLSKKNLDLPRIKSMGIDEEESIDYQLKMFQNLKGANQSAEDKRRLELLENQTLIDKINYEVVAKGFHKGEITCMDVCAQRPIIATLSKEDSTIRIWNYETGQCELKKSYASHQKEFTGTNQYYLQSLALHPLGIFLAIGFMDKVKLYHLIHGDTREYVALDIKNCINMKFSNGGQLLACVDLKEISIFRTYQAGVEAPKRMPGPSPHVSAMDFNYNDTFLTMVSRDGFIQKYDLVKYDKCGECVIDKSCHFTSVIFSQEYANQEQIEQLTKKIKYDQLIPNQKIIEKTYVVGSLNNGERLIRCYDEKDNPIADIAQAPIFQGVQFNAIIEVNVANQRNRDLNGGISVGGNLDSPRQNPDSEENKKGKQKLPGNGAARNLIIAGSNGRIWIYGMSKFLKKKRECDMMNGHQGGVTIMRKSNDSSVVITAGSDGAIFVYRVNEVPNKRIGWWSKKVEQMQEIQKKEIEMEKHNQAKEINHQDFSNSANIAQNNLGQNTIDQENTDQQQTIETNATGHNMADSLLESDDESDEHETYEQVINKRKQPFNIKAKEAGRMLSSSEIFASSPYCTIDTRLSNVVLIEKKTMDEWRKQQEDLRLDMEKENNTVESQLRNEKYEFEKRLAEMEKQKSEELNNLNSVYTALQQKENKDKDSNTDMMKKNELNHLQCFEELQGLYEKKLQMEQRQFNLLKQQKDLLENDYLLEIKEISRINEQAKDQLLKDFQIQLKTVQDEYDKSKKEADGLKMIYEEKITQTDDDDKGEINENSRVYEEEIKQLKEVIETIKDDIESIKRQISREESEKQEFLDQAKRAISKKNFRVEQMEAKNERINVLVTEKSEIQDKLKEKEKELYKYKFKIKDLQKTKQVLTHRTQEMKASLEPKEQEIESVKEELKKLEGQYDIQAKEIKQLEKLSKEKDLKIDKIFKKLEKEKLETKKYQNTIGQFVTEIHDAVQSKEDGGKNSRRGNRSLKDDEQDKMGPTNKLYALYNKYYTPYAKEIEANSQKDPETIEELSRQLQFMEKSINELKIQTAKNNVKSKANINRWLTENQTLMTDLENIRERKIAMEKEKLQLELEIQKLKLDIQKKERDFENKLYVLYKDNAPKEENVVNDDELGVAELRSLKSKGKLFKGTPFLRRTAEDKQRIKDLENALEDKKQQRMMCKLEKRSLQEQIIRLLDERVPFFQK